MNNKTEIGVIGDFIHLRINQKNSLSNLGQIKNIITKETEKNLINQLLEKLDNDLTEGHTISYLNNIDNKDIINNFDYFVKSGWLTILQNNDNDIKTPIIAKQKSDGWIVWLQRQWFAEKQLASQILQIANTPIKKFDLSDVQNFQSDNQPNALQQQAIDKASNFAFSIITGGPGTGKTFTVAKLVINLLLAHDKRRKLEPNLPPLSIALTAPTGKASQRMQESLNKSLESSRINLDNAKTLHRLLGIGQDGVPRYHRDNPLPDDLVIVDEASMLGLELASQLVDAIKPNGRLVLLGDANQLSAVDAGSVLSDLCKVTQLLAYRTQLTESKRFASGSKVGRVALILQQAIFDEKQANIDSHLASVSVDSFLKKPQFYHDYEKIIWFKSISEKIYPVLAQHYLPFFDLVKAWYKNPVDIHLAENRQKLFQVFDGYRILSAGHHGKIGTTLLNEKMRDFYFSYSKQQRKMGYFFHGLPIMIKRNDYHLGLFNGDIGICLVVNSGLVACFVDKVIGIHRLSVDLCDMAYAMSIHKSQGSEFERVAVCLDKSHDRLLSQELIYTAITRSKHDLLIFGDKATLDKALGQKTIRQTGLLEQFEVLKG